MAFPLNLSDISLILAVESIVLLVTSELLSPYYGAANLKINKKRIRNTALVMSASFLITVAIRIVGMLLSP
jgi:hypothetical protein